MELLRLHFPGVHRALREALDSINNFASYLLGDTVPSAEERGENLSRSDGRSGEELGEMNAEGSQQAEESKKALKEEMINSRDLEVTFTSRGSESREVLEEGKEKKVREIQISEVEGNWEIGKDVAVCPNEMTKVCTTWDSSNKNSKEIKGKIRGNYKIDVQGTWCMMETETNQGQKIDVAEARECKKEGILAEGYVETEEFASEEKSGRELKAQGKKNQEPSEKEVSKGKSENYWKGEEIEPVGEQKEEVKEIKSGDLEKGDLKAFGVESESGIIQEQEKEEDRQTQETEKTERDLQEAREVEKGQSMKKGEAGNDPKIEMETRRSHEPKMAPDVGRGYRKDGKRETPEKQELEKHEVKEVWEAERTGIRCAKSEAIWEVLDIKPLDIDTEKLQGVQELGEKTERDVKSEAWITSVMEEAKAREAVKSKTAEINPKKEAEEAWNAEDIEISREWNMEVIKGGSGIEAADGEDLERKKDEERETEENPFPEQVQTQKTEREEEQANFWILGKKESMKVLESGIEAEGSWGLEGEAGGNCENQLGQKGGQDIQEIMVWEGTLDNFSRINKSESLETKEVTGGWETKFRRPQEVEGTEIDNSDETSVTGQEKEVEGVKLMREVGKSQEMETEDKVSHGTEEVRENQNLEEIGENWNMEAETWRSQEIEKKPKKIQDLMEDEGKGREEESFINPERETLEGYEIEVYSVQNTENENVQEVKKQDLVVMEGWKIVEGKAESGQVTETEDKGGCKGEEEVFIFPTGEDKKNWEPKGSQEFKQQEVPRVKVKTGWGTKEAGTIEPEMEQEEVKGVWEKELEGGQEVQADRGHKLEESKARKLQEREVMEAKEYWEAEGEVLRSQEMKVEGNQEREDKSGKALDREAKEVWEGNAGSPWNTEIVNEKVGLNFKEIEAGRGQDTVQKMKRDQKEIKRDWNSEEAESQGEKKARKSPGSNLLEIGVRKVLEEENKDFWEVEGTECQRQGMTERDQVAEKSEAGRTWEREERKSEEEKETGSSDPEESWIVKKEEAGNNCEKEKSAFCLGVEIQMVMTNKVVEFGREEEMKEMQIKSEKKSEESKEKRETEEVVDGDQGVNSESTYLLEEETQHSEDTQTEAKAGGSHAVEGESSMDDLYIEKVEVNGARRLETEKMEGSDNIEEAGSQGAGNRKELEPDGCSDPEKAAGWKNGDKNSETSGACESNEKTGRVLEPDYGRGTEEAIHTGSRAPEATENKETEAPAPTNLIALRLSPASDFADKAQSSWNEAPIPGPCLDLSIPRSRVLLSRNASQRRSRPSFRRAPEPKKDDSDNDDESLGVPLNEGTPAPKLRLLQSEETAVQSPPKPEGTPVTARKRPLGHGFGLAHPSMMQELQARLGRPKPQ